MMNVKMTGITHTPQVYQSAYPGATRSANAADAVFFGKKHRQAEDSNIFWVASSDDYYPQSLAEHFLSLNMMA